MTAATPELTANVLIVDDPPAAAALAAFLGAQGHRVRVAAGDADVAAGLADVPPDVAVVDLGVGPAAVDRLVNLSRRSLLIALLRPETAQRYPRERLSSFDYVFFKAVSPEVLAQKITKYMADRTGQHKPLKD